MAEQVISCPKCSARIPLSEAIAQPLREAAQKQFEGEAAQLREAFAAREKSLLEKQQAMAKEFSADRERAEKEAAKRAEERGAIEMRDLQSRLQEQEKKLEESRQNELNLRRRERELEDAKKSAELEQQRQLDSERKRIEAEATQRADQQHRQKQLESEKVIADLTKAAEEMRRKLEQGSQQTQGEVVELELEAQLRSLFPYDVIEGVAKGIRGADIVQRVVRNGKVCGTIIWESKQTKAWSEGWIDKLKEDQRAAKAEVAVLMTAALPKGVFNFTQMNGVFVTNQACVPSLATTLRWAMVQHALARSLAENTDGKMKALYSYLTGSEFRQRVEAINDASGFLREQLQKERRLYEKNWAEREKLINRVENSLLGMHGDLQGLGAALEHVHEIDGDQEAEAIPALPKRTTLPQPDRAEEEAEGLF